jgi:hypothetical protein
LGAVGVHGSLAVTCGFPADEEGDGRGRIPDEGSVRDGAASGDDGCNEEPAGFCSGRREA